MYIYIYRHIIVISCLITTCHVDMAPAPVLGSSTSHARPADHLDLPGTTSRSWVPGPNPSTRPWNAVDSWPAKETSKKDGFSGIDGIDNTVFQNISKHNCI